MDQVLYNCQSKYIRYSIYLHDLKSLIYINYRWKHTNRNVSQTYNNIQLEYN